MLLKYLLKKYTTNLNKHSLNRADTMPKKQTPPFPLGKTLEKNVENFRGRFGLSEDVKYHQFTFGKAKDDKCCLIYLDGMADAALLSENVVKPLMFAGEEATAQKGFTIDYIVSNILYSAELKTSSDTAELINAILSGDTVMLKENADTAVIIGSKGYVTKAISEPQTEMVVRGPREGFTEDYRTNTSLMRRIIKNPDLKIEPLVKGKKTTTSIAIVYIEKIADPRLIALVKKRIEKLDIDAVLDSGYIEQYFEDSPFSLFPTVGYTEKPDVASAKILEGRVAVLVDGSPFALTVPYMFIENFQNSGDYYIRPFFATLLRILRLVSFLLSISLVPIYLAMTTFHQELIPTTLLFTIANAREGTPFPAFIEAFILVFSFELLREAGVRMPRPVGQSISIVGALIMGDAAVKAGLVGAPIVIAVAISAVAEFITPEQVDTIAIMRLFLMIFAAVLGGFGIAMGFLIMLIHLCSLNSFGMPYFSSVVTSRNIQDSFIRAPLWMMTKRPAGVADKDQTRLKAFVPPEPVSVSIDDERDAQNENGGKQQ